MNILKKGQTSRQQIVERCTSVFKDGGVVVFPTDTVYGLLADATNPTAVSKLITLKHRPVGKPISIFVGTMERLREAVVVSESTDKRLQKMLPGPFTIVLPSRHAIDPRLESEHKGLGVRIPQYDLVNELVEHFGGPLTATSANLSGRSANYTATGFLRTLSEQKKELIDLVVDQGSLPRRKPSTVVDLSGDDQKVLRAGDIDLNEVESVITSCAQDTEKVARELIARLDAEKKDKPLVILLEGEVGAGKTVFVKGVASHFGIDNIISPTFVVYYDYPFAQERVLVHADLYHVQEASEFEHLGLEEYFRGGAVLCVEWSERAGPIYEYMRSHAQIVTVHIEHVDEQTRAISIDETGV